MKPEIDDTPSSATFAILVVAAVALAAALSMVFLVFGNQGLVTNAGDPYHYGEIGRSLVERGFDKVTRRAAMLYPHLLAAIYWAGGGDFFVQILQSVLHAATAVLVFVIGRRLYNRRTAVVAGVLTGLHPMLLRYVADLHTETLLVFMFTLTVWCAIRFFDRPTVANGIVLGFIGMVATLTKGVALPFVAAFMAVWSVRTIRQRGFSVKALVPALAVFLTMAAVVAPWTYRNYKVSGRFVLLTPGMPDAFLRGYVFTRLEFATLQRPPYTDAENESNQWFRRIARDAGTTWELDEIVDDENNKRVMKQMILEHPVDSARKVVVGFFTFWYEMTNLTNSLVAAGLALACWVLALIGWRRAHAEGRASWLLLLPILVVNVFVATLIPLGRYSVPVLPCLTILAAFGIDTLLNGRAVRTRSLPLKSLAA